MRDQNYRLRFAHAREKAKDYRASVINYLAEHYDIATITTAEKEFVAEKFKLTVQTINQYLRELKAVRNDYDELSQKYPLNPNLLSIGAQNAAALTFDDICRLNVDSRIYSTDVPVGKFIWRLDFKMWGKDQKFGYLHFTECSNGSRYKISTFAQNGKLVIGKTELLQCNGTFFELEVYKNEKGYKNIKWIKRLT